MKQSPSNTAQLLFAVVVTAIVVFIVDHAVSIPHCKHRDHADAFHQAPVINGHEGGGEGGEGALDRPPRVLRLVEPQQAVFTPARHSVADHGAEEPAPKVHDQLDIPPAPFSIGSDPKTFPWIVDHTGQRNGMLEVNSHRFEYHAMLDSPRVALLKGMATMVETDAMVATARGVLERSRVNNKIGSEVNPVRTSQGMFLVTEEQRNLKANIELRARVSAIIGVAPDRIEGTQILKYEPGQFYRAHPDYFPDDDERNLARGGNRFATVVVWLNEVKDGGGTTFPKVPITMHPRRGDAVLFYSAKPDGVMDPMSFHSGDPPGPGSEKWIAVFWVRPRHFV